MVNKVLVLGAGKVGLETSRILANNGFADIEIVSEYAKEILKFNHILLNYMISFHAD